MFQDLYKGHNLCQKFCGEFFDSFNFGGYNLYYCSLCSCYMAITILPDNKNSTFILDNKTDDWINFSNNLNEILNCNEVLIQNIIE